MTLAITETATCSNPDLETTAVNRDAPTANIVTAGGDQDLVGGGSFAITIGGALIAPGDTIDIEINMELTDSATATPIYDLTRATLSYTGNAG